MIVTSLHRYAVKGLGGETLAVAPLRPGFGLAGDRAFAFARPGSAAHAAADITLLAPESRDPSVRSPWPDLAKTNFLQRMQDEALAALAALYDAEGARLVLIERDGARLEGEVTSSAGRAVLEARVGSLCGLAVPPRLVFARRLGFCDSAPKGAAGLARLSLINRASLDVLAALIGADVAPARFRGNILIEGAAPWAEFGWLGRRLQIGEVTFRVEKRIARCPAIEVDPGTGARDLPLLKFLQRHMGHTDCGVYLHAETEGAITAGDALRLVD